VFVEFIGFSFVFGSSQVLSINSIIVQESYQLSERRKLSETKLKLDILVLSTEFAGEKLMETKFDCQLDRFLPNIFLL